MKSTIGILHPGAMGTSIAASAIHNGHTVLWASEGRSDATRARAAQYSLLDVVTLQSLCDRSDLILSICPPHAAEGVARQVISQHFRGLYCDCNAISPQRARDIGDLFRPAGIEYVDGGIIGGPAWQSGETWLYLSGTRAQEIAASFSEGPLETQIIGEEIGKASALKMCYAAYTKGTTALLCAILATADSQGVLTELEGQWNRDESGFAEQVERRVRGVTAKAWRFEGEMREISDTFRSAGMPGGFHLAAAEIYHRLAPLQNTPDLQRLEQVLALLAK